MLSAFLKNKKLYQTLVVYLGSSWAIIEAAIYFVPRLNYPDYYIDVLTVLLAFGLVAVVYNEWVNFNRQSGKAFSKNATVGANVIIIAFGLATTYSVYNNAKLSYIRFEKSHADLASIAVLPFENLGPDSSYHWMGDAICGELINHLDNVGSIDVKSKSASFYFKNKDYNPVQIANLLGVNSMLDGSIMVLDSTYRITVSLINPLTGSQMWNENFEGKLSNIFDLQSEIALSIADKINADITAGEKKSIEKKLTNNQQAYEYYLKGKYHYNLVSAADNRRAYEYFKKATELDPEFKMAYAYLALTYEMFGGAWLGITPDSAFQVVDQLADKIFTLDEDNAMGLFLKSNVVYFYNHDYDRGIEIATEAFEKSQDKEDIIWFYVMMLSMNRQADKSVAILEDYIAKNPTSAQAYQGLCHARLMLKGRDTDTPIEYFYEPCFKCTELDPNFSYGRYYLAELHFIRGEYEQSREYWQFMADLNPYAMFYEGLMRSSYYMGDTVAAERYFEQVKAQYQLGYASPIIMVRAYSTLDEIDSVVKYLELSFAIKDIELVALWNEPAYDRVRDEPRFQEILARMQNAGPVAGEAVLK